MNLFRWLRAAAFDWAVIALAVLAVALARHWDSPLRWGVYGLGVVLVGCRQHALAVLGHEGAHGHVSDLLADVLAFHPIFGAVGSYRVFHFQHHDFLGSRDDPEYRGKRALAALGDVWRLPLTKRTFVVELLVSLAGLRCYMTLLVLTDLFPKRPAAILSLAGVWALILATLWVFGTWWVMGLWLGALATSFWTAFWLRGWTEHIGTADTHRVSATWWQRFLFLPHNTHCHWEHHWNADIPFWQLPRAREYLSNKSPPTPLGELWRQFGASPAARSYEPRDGASHV